MSPDPSKDEAAASKDKADGEQNFKKPGDVIARQYEVIEMLGEGGASVVYRCKHAILGTECAIKVLLPDRLPDARAIQRFQLEAKSIGRLEHAHIVAVHEFAVDDDNQPYLVMDFVNGKNLATLTEDNSFILPKRALKLFTQIAQALVHAHERGVIHRDLKPKNVIVENPGQSGESARLVDFGIAKITETETDKNLTQTGEAFGSPLFMSPEQCKGSPLDQRSDIYSFGCLMYEVVTGQVAAQADSVLETLMLHVNGLKLDFDNAPPAVTLKENANRKGSAEAAEYKCFTGLRKVIETCTNTEPERRYQTCAALLQDLQAIAQGQTPSGSRSSNIKINPRALNNWEWTTQSLVIAGAILVLCITAPIVFLVAQGDIKPQKTAKEKEIEAKFSKLLGDVPKEKDSAPEKERLPARSGNRRITIVTDDTNTVLSAFSACPRRGFYDETQQGLFTSGMNFSMSALEKAEKLGCTDFKVISHKISDEQLFNLSKLKRLNWLNMNECSGFSKKGIGALKHSNLEKIYLSSAGLTDDWAPLLASLPVNTLAVTGNDFTDKGANILAHSKSLKYILLEGNPISEFPSELKKCGFRLLPEENGTSMWFTRK
jgi:serine/threonine protein kinase